MSILVMIYFLDQVSLQVWHFINPLSNARNQVNFDCQSIWNLWSFALLFFGMLVLLLGSTLVLGLFSVCQLLFLSVSSALVSRENSVNSICLLDATTHTVCGMHYRIALISLRLFNFKGLLFKKLRESSDPMA